MQLNIIHNEECLTGLRKLPDNSVDCCVTSPPYFNLRDYGVDGQIGLEDTPEEYILRMVEVFNEVRRVLKPEGTLWVNIGDSYAGSMKGAANYPENAMNYKHGTNRGTLGVATIVKKYSGYKRKDLIGIPWMLAFALRADGWYLRQDIIWNKRNTMPESVADRCTKTHEYIFLLSKSPRYYFDAESIAEPVADSTLQRISQNIDGQKGSDRVPGKTNGPMKAAIPRYEGKKYTKDPEVFYRTKSGNAYNYRPKRNKRSVWELSTARCKEAHFATYPEKLVQPCILAGCPEGGIVLDPFMGSGTTGLVAKKLGRNYIGFELNPDYAKMAERRINSILL